MSVAVMPAPVDTDGALNKRKRSRSPSLKNDGAPPTSRRRSHSPPSNGLLERPRVVDADPQRKAERERQLAARAAAAELEKTDNPKEKEFDAQAEFAKLIGSRSGGVYMPPARLRAMQEAAAKDKSSPEYQRMAWDALRKSITGIVNRVNIVNIKQVVPELFSENLVRGRGLFARSVMKAQAASLPFTPVFAALVAIINTKLPQVGELVLMRLISQFRRSFKRNDKIVCNSSTTFLAHLVNQAVAPPIVALQIFMLLLEHPTDDSIEIAVSFMREVGAFLTENSPKGTTFVFERFRTVLNEGAISQRVQYMIEVLMQVRKDKFKDNPIMPEGLDLVDEDEQITHQIELEDDMQVQEGLNIFKFDPDYGENEERYKSIKAEILGEDSDEESGSEEESSDEDEDEDEVAETKEGIEDRTETNLVNLRRVIYLTIMNALNYEEAVHKLLKVQIDEGQEIELVNMIIECCSQERSYSTFYGLIGERLSKLNRVWTECFENAFGNYYTTIHRYETNRLRNIARFFGHLFSTDSISWVVFECVKLNEDDTTSSSRIFIKILMNEMMESMGLKALAERFKDPEIKRNCEGMFPIDVPKNTRFAINYFTSIGLGIITEDMREYLKNAPRLIMEQRRAMLEAESSSSDSSDSDSSDSDSDSDTTSSSGSESNASARDRRRRYSSSPPRRRGRDISRSPPPRHRESRSPPPRHGRDDSRSPPPKHRHHDPRSPEPRHRRYDSKSPPPRDSRRRPSIPPRSPSPPPRGVPPSKYDRRDAPLRYDSPPRDTRRSNGSGIPTRREPSLDRRERDRRAPAGRRSERSTSRERSPPPHMSRNARRSKSPTGHGDGRREHPRERNGALPPNTYDRERERRRSPPRRDDKGRRGGYGAERERDNGYQRRR
ncbi:Pre-mRNA-splicing factor CWC22 [Termitomyces sp. T112]|nr:Pre-mRNA-splicing factor CWC22 [Termitomyces sp. T112]